MAALVLRNESSGVRAPLESWCSGGAARGSAAAAGPPGGGGAGSGADLFGGISAQQPGGFDQEDRDEDHERDAVAVLRAVGEVSDGKDFDQAEDQAAEDGAGDVPD